MEAQRPLDPSEELWRVRRVHGSWSASRCTCRTVSIDIRRTRLDRQPETVTDTMAEWWAKRLANGWRQPE
jgi:hypothetical protein